MIMIMMIMIVILIAINDNSCVRMNILLIVVPVRNMQAFRAHECSFTIHAIEKWISDEKLMVGIVSGNVSNNEHPNIYGL